MYSKSIKPTQLGYIAPTKQGYITPSELGYIIFKHQPLPSRLGYKYIFKYICNFHLLPLIVSRSLRSLANYLTYYILHYFLPLHSRNFIGEGKPIRKLRIDNSEAQLLTTMKHLWCRPSAGYIAGLQVLYITSLVTYYKQITNSLQEQGTQKSKKCM